ncbi:capsular exopolysaccharide family [Novosphingobium sp. CF614]|uniref:GumC family protein n=1 Tax=Novosphingobium sp. CF614 TaxID=1884364 RepID=UPI0008E91E2C|nr:polysaccharide biosynthesis tyrosine autokinase [Novosphingobium sp. CF614]SFG20669.1 capsular exopolysaccharide family [Novosphingobium sp. CF614]
MNEITAPSPPERPEGSRRSLVSAGTTALAHPLDTQKSPNQFDVNEVWRILMKWRWLILGVLIAGVAVSIIVTISTTPVYRATSTLEINTEPMQLMQQQTDLQPVARNEPQFLATQIGLLSSRTLAERVMRGLSLADDESFVKGYPNRADREGAAIAKLMGHLEVTPLRGSNLIMIGYKDPDAGRSARVVNAFAQGFIDSSLERRYNATAFARQFLQSRLDATRTKLEVSERALVAYARANNILSLGSTSVTTGKDGGSAGGGSTAQDSLSAQSLVSLNDALSAAIGDRIAAEQAYREGASAASTSAEDSPAIQGLRAQLAGVQADYQQKLGTFRPDYPEMVALRQRMESINRSIATGTGKLRSSQSNALRAAYLAARGREQQLQAQVNAYRSNVLELRNRGIQYNILQRDLDTNRSMYDALLQRLKEVSTTGGVGESQASIVDNATPPSAPFIPNVYENLAIGLLAGLVLGLGLAFAIEFIDDTLKTPDDVINKLRVPLLGVVPKGDKGTSFVDALKEQRSEISEAYYTIMSSIQFVSNNSFPRTVLVTSTRPSEGKSSSALALAQNLARTGSRVLLVDADMRKPSFKTNQPDEIGLATLLVSPGSAKDHVAATSIPNLSLLPSGPVPLNPAQLLATNRIDTILMELVEHFDVVVIDSPPILGFADVPILSAICDATILVVEAGAVRRPAVLSSLRRLLAANGQVIGTILTKYNPKNGGYGYGYGAGYGYGYGYGYGRHQRQRYGENTEIRQLDIDSVA